MEPLRDQAAPLLDAWGLRIKRGPIKLYTTIKPLSFSQWSNCMAPTPSPTHSGLGLGTRKGWAFDKFLPFDYVLFDSAVPESP